MAKQKQGGAIINQYLTEEYIPELRLLVVSSDKVVVFHPDIPNADQISVGLSMAAAPKDSLVDVIEMGTLERNSWGLTPGAVYYASENGELTTTKPEFQPLIKVGVAVDYNRLKVCICHINPILSLSGFPKISVGTTPPDSPKPNDIWIDVS